MVALSGQELVPVLEAPRRVITDSTAILAWLERRRPSRRCGRRTPRSGRRRTSRSTGSTRSGSAPPNAIDASAAAASPTTRRSRGWSAELRLTLPWFEALLDGRDFLLGDRWARPTSCAFPFLKYGVVRPPPGDAEPFHWILNETCAIAAQLPRLEAWIRRIDALPRA